MKNLIVLCLGLMSCFYVFAQEKTIIYDFKVDSFKIKEKNGDSINVKIKEGDFVKVIVENLNPFLYEVNASIQTITKNPVPASFSKFIIGDFSGIANIPQFTTQDSGGQFIGLSVDSLVIIEKPCYVSQRVDSLQTAYLDFIDEIIKYNDLFLLLKDENVKKSSINTGLCALKPELISELYHKLKRFYLDISLEKAVATCVENNKYIFLSAIINELIKPAAENEIYKLVELRKNAKIYGSKPLIVETFKATGDEIKLEVNITPRAEAKLLERPLRTIKAKHKFLINNERKISFSSGFVLTTGFNNSNYNSMPLQRNDSTTVHKIVQEDEPGLGYGINAMINFITNEESNSYGFTIGFGFLPQETKLLGLAGVTWLPGKKQKVLISGGLGVGYKKTLSDALNLDDEYAAAPEIKTKAELSYAPWISLAYRL